jgi:hypothetical protein
MTSFSFRYSRRCATIYEPNGRIAFVQRLMSEDYFTSRSSHRSRPRSLRKWGISTPRTFVYERLSAGLTGTYRSALPAPTLTAAGLCVWSRSQRNGGNKDHPIMESAPFVARRLPESLFAMARRACISRAADLRSRGDARDSVN